MTPEEMRALLPVWAAPVREGDGMMAVRTPFTMGRDPVEPPLEIQGESILVDYMGAAGAPFSAGQADQGDPGFELAMIAARDHGLEIDPGAGLLRARTAPGETGDALRSMLQAALAPIATAPHPAGITGRGGREPGSPGGIGAGGTGAGDGLK